MLGAIVGDIVGSRFEFDNIKSKDFELFQRECFSTDDSIMTMAVGKAIMECDGDYTSLGDKAVFYMQKIGRPYLNCGYGGNFYRWMYTDNPQPYNSFGNGSAMRVSCCGWVAGSPDQAKELSKKVTEISHNHPEGLKGAEATTMAIYLARNGESKENIKKLIDSNYYPMDFSLDQIRDEYEFDETCQHSVPQALMAFFESTDFEDAIRNAISIGGDSDTLAAIAGSVGEAYYGVPGWIKDKALTYLDQRLRSIYDQWTLFIANGAEKR